MTFPRMRNDLRPLCPAHNKPMVFASFWLKVDTDEFQKLCYSCEEPDCYLYDIVNGYYRIRPGESINRDMRYWLRCSLDGVPMYIGLFDPQGSKRSWFCGQLGCKGSRTTEGALQASAATP